MTTGVGASDQGRVALIPAIATSGPSDEGSRQRVRGIRDDKIAGVRLSVTRATAINVDTADTSQRARVTYLELVVDLSFILLTMPFRSLLVPLIAALGYPCLFAASLGANVAIFQ
ncbi:hypothetical protein [Curtobacterium flaccumfaciens]|uniref:hypothetical protein n=1 Tax=Curtobacterium flaccumfaciens TaxID=2035 RepID=UPI001E4D91DA|nr:hypothetical protein [Curtobacterium allii]MCE0459480.1 hypothetical protein [Curtobacterium allii]